MQVLNCCTTLVFGNFINDIRSCKIWFNAYILWSFLNLAEIVKKRNLSWMLFRGAIFPPCASQVSIFNSPDHTSIALLFDVKEGYNGLTVH